MAVLKPMLKLALLPLLLLLILVQWVGIFLTTFSIVLTNLLAGLFFFVALASWVMKLADGGEVLKMLVTAFVVFVLPYIAIAAIAKISFFAEELRDFLQCLNQKFSCFIVQHLNRLFDSILHLLSSCNFI